MTAITNMNHRNIVFSIGLDTKQSTVFGQGLPVHLNNSRTRNPNILYCKKIINFFNTLQIISLCDRYCEPGSIDQQDNNMDAKYLISGNIRQKAKILA